MAPFLFDHRASMIAALSLRPGDLCAFETSPFTSFGASCTGRHAALKILATDGKAIAWAVLDGMFPRRPLLAEVVDAQVLRRQRFAFTGEPAMSSTSQDFDPDLLDFTVLGSGKVKPTELALLAQHRSYAAWRWASFDAEGEWRWKHDQRRSSASSS